jgi:hypothetical protein
MDEEIAAGLTLVALDQYDRVFDTYNGTVHFSTNATVGSYTLPADYTFVPGDMGNKTFAGGMLFNDPGWFYVHVGDIVNITAEGMLSGIHVFPKAPEIHYKLYDMFEEPFGQWWWGNSATYKGRIVKYQTDQILWNETHKHISLYNPGYPSNDHTLIMAPYRWTTDAKNISWVTVNNPYFVPVRSIDGYGTPAPITPGGEAKIDIRTGYVDEQRWITYWVPLLGGGPIVRDFLKNQGDGYFVETFYRITMNREMAQQWINLSLSETDVATWWSIYSIDYEFFFRDWIVNQGNVVYDIFSGYEDTFYDYFYHADLTENMATGEIVLDIGYPNFGYDVLMPRWLSASGLCVHEVYWDDITLNATMNEQYSNVFFDAVGTYNLHAVKANQSTGTDGAWVWEPSRVDYIPSNYSAVYHHSDFDPYYPLRYTSWCAGDTVGYWAQPVKYDATPQWFNLTDYMTLTIELPKGANVPAYKAQSVPVGSVAASRLGDISNYVPLEYNGTMSLGFSIPDLRPMYDAASQTLTLSGPMNFDNPRDGTGLLYHGAPWIEFNVSGGGLKAQSADVAGPASVGTSSQPVLSELVSFVSVATAVMVLIAALVSMRRTH